MRYITKKTDQLNFSLITGKNNVQLCLARFSRFSFYRHLSYLSSPTLCSTTLNMATLSPTYTQKKNTPPSITKHAQL